MEASYVAPGQTMDHTPGSDVAVGDVVVVGEIVAVANQAIPANELGALNIKGVHEFVKKTGSAIAAGKKVYWDNTNKEITSTASTHKVAGHSVAATLSADTLILVDLARA